MIFQLQTLNKLFCQLGIGQSKAISSPGAKCSNELDCKRFWSIRFFRFLVFLPFFLLSPFVAAQGEGVKDLLLIPAKMSAKAQTSLLMDVVNNHGRLVAVGERGHILYSDNHGQTWIQAKVPVSVTLTAVTFATAKKGWAVGHDGVVLHTQDSGLSWQKQLDGNTINQVMLAQLKKLIETKSKALNMALLPKDALQQQVLAQELEDLNFFLSDVEIAAREGPITPLMDLWFKNEREGIVIGAFGVILRTTDAGANWVPLADRIHNPQGLHYYGITQAEDTLFIAGENGILFRSDDWGQTWQSITSPYKGSIFGITGRSEGVWVIAFGLRGNTFYSHDRGRKWTVSEYTNNASVSGATVLADGSVCLAGVDGTLMCSIDEGQSFSRLPSRFPGAIALTGTDGGDLVVVGLRGVTVVGRKP